MKSSGFRRIAFGLIAVSLITAAAAAIYLYFNFNSKSNLILLVPQESDWVYQFRTRQIKGKLKGTPPPYFDSLRRSIQNMPAFKNVKDAGEVGVALYSDIIVFSNSNGWYLALSLISEPRLSSFIKDKMPKELAGGIIPHPDCKYIKVKDRNLYFAWKHKACLFFVPKDTVENLDKTNAALSLVFNEKNTNSVTNHPVYKELNDHDDDVLFCSMKTEINELSQGVTFTDKGVAQYYYPNAKGKVSKVSPLFLFNKSGLQITDDDVQRNLFKDNSISTNHYLNLTFKTMYHYLRPFTNE